MWFGITLVERFVMMESGPCTFFICTVNLVLHLRKITENLSQDSKSLLHTFVLYIWRLMGSNYRFADFGHLCCFSIDIIQPVFNRGDFLIAKRRSSPHHLTLT